MIPAYMSDVAHRSQVAVREAVEALSAARRHHNELLTLVLETALSDFAVSMADSTLWQQGKDWGRSAADASDALGDKEASMMARANAATCALLLGEDPQPIILELGEALSGPPGPETSTAQSRRSCAWRRHCRRRENSTLAAGLAACALRLAREQDLDVSANHRVLLSRHIEGLRDRLGQEEYNEAVRPWESFSLEQATRAALAADISAARS